MTSDRSSVLLRRQASRRSSRGEAPYMEQGEMSVSRDAVVHNNGGSSSSCNELYLQE